ncbi:unnamed protein product [Vicia faba]|uniref:Uncharacterized protein n=1 Tax=Vicia faba TaxID=3906 RepID=A0AAV1AP37_VICFA|nr:unnamed protein product [Vicia faba]
MNQTQEQQKQNNSIHKQHTSRINSNKTFHFMFKQKHNNKETQNSKIRYKTKKHRKPPFGAKERVHVRPEQLTTSQNMKEIRSVSKRKNPYKLGLRVKKTGEAIE